MSYFDYNATTPLLPEARAVWLEAAERHWHNPSSLYRSANRAHAFLENCRERIAEQLQCAPESIVFNSGATEGNYSLLAYFQQLLPVGQKVALSAIEHPSVKESATALFGSNCILLPIDGSGVLQVDTAEALLKKQSPGLVSLIAANNETGILQPWQAMLPICRNLDIPLHVDAAQWLGKESPSALGQADFVTGCAHKFGGPKGVGFLKINAQHLNYRAALGGHQESGHRAGTEDLCGISAMTTALETVDWASERERLGKCRTAFEHLLRKSIEGVRIVGGDTERLANTSLVIFPRHDHKRWVLQLDKRGFQVSTGSACSSGVDGPSHVLTAMGIPAECALRAVRVSGGLNTHEDDWIALAHAMIELWEYFEHEDSESATVVEI